MKGPRQTTIAKLAKILSLCMEGYQWESSQKLAIEYGISPGYVVQMKDLGILVKKPSEKFEYGIEGNKIYTYPAKLTDLAYRIVEGYRKRQLSQQTPPITPPSNYVELDKAIDFAGEIIGLAATFEISMDLLPKFMVSVSEVFKRYK